MEIQFPNVGKNHSHSSHSKNWAENKQLNNEIRKSEYKEKLLLHEIVRQVFETCIQPQFFGMDIILAADYEVRATNFPR